MALVSDIIPALIGGVSQIPSAARLPGKAEISLNALMTVSAGNDKRPPSEYVARLARYSGASPEPTYATPMVHWVDRDSVTQYCVVIENGVLRVFDQVDGSERVVNITGSADDYLATASARADLDATTIADTTFIWNKSIPVANLATASPAAVYEAMLFVRAGAYGRKYTVTINGTEYFYSTVDGSGSWNAVCADTNFIAEVLIEGIAATGAGSIPAGWDTTSRVAVSATSLNALGGAFTVARRGSVILITNTSAFDISIDDGQGGAAMSLITAHAARLSDLPQKAWDGYTVRIGQITEDREADLYLVFNDADDDGTGEWVETVGPSVNDGIDPETMPIQLVLEDTGEFTLQYAEWTSRTVGTSESSPDPAFVGRAIEDVFYYLGRVCIQSGEDYSFSAAEDLLRFYRETTREILADDPFTLTATTPETAFLKKSVTHAGTIVAFTNKSQCQLQQVAEQFGRGGATLIETTRFETDTGCRPVSIGGSLLFASSSSGFTHFNEYTVLDAARGAVSQEPAQDIPKYVPSGVFKMATTAEHAQLVALTPSAPNSVWVWRWYQPGRERLQSAWSEWRLASGLTVLSANFYGPRLHLLVNRPSYGLYLEVIDVSPERLDTGSTYRTRLDGLVSEADCSIAYDSGTDVTTVTLPYIVTGLTLEMVAREIADDPTGRVLTLLSQSGSALTVAGDYRTIPFFVGRPYTWQHRFSTLYVREDRENQSGAPVLDGRLQVADMTLDCVFPGNILARVTNEQRTPYEKRAMGYVAELLNDPAAENTTSSKFRFRVAGQNTKVVIDLINDTFLPSKILGCQWRGNHTRTAQGL